jgi:hypothetical protein
LAAIASISIKNLGLASCGTYTLVDVGRCAPKCRSRTARST